mmetsp:Transcript_8653/g.16567  ORF Transcript_8653/g.16567 Transcript_8653/m.16567 type:complete len:484 (-) Transcript_8653:389-1840(-)
MGHKQGTAADVVAVEITHALRSTCGVQLSPIGADSSVRVVARQDTLFGTLHQGLDGEVEQLDLCFRRGTNLFQSFASVGVKVISKPPQLVGFVQNLEWLREKLLPAPKVGSHQDVDARSNVRRDGDLLELVVLDRILNQDGAGAAAEDKLERPCQPALPLERIFPPSNQGHASTWEIYLSPAQRHVQPLPDPVIKLERPGDGRRNCRNSGGNHLFELLDSLLERWRAWPLPPLRFPHEFIVCEHAVQEGVQAADRKAPEQQLLERVQPELLVLRDTEQFRVHVVEFFAWRPQSRIVHLNWIAKVVDPPHCIEVPRDHADGLVCERIVVEVVVFVETVYVEGQDVDNGVTDVVLHFKPRLNLVLPVFERKKWLVELLVQAVQVIGRTVNVDFSLKGAVWKDERGTVPVGRVCVGFIQVPVFAPPLSFKEFIVHPVYHHVETYVVPVHKQFSKIRSRRCQPDGLAHVQRHLLSQKRRVKQAAFQH